MIKIQIPSHIQFVLDTLKKHGYHAYIVGGCVRDALIGRSINDYDVTTNALPDQISTVFDGYHIIDTGIKHGTVTAIIDKQPIEITTYRIDGKYIDNRHPESVIFTDRIENDLARRDFTINSMAYNDKNGLVDIFGGQNDLSAKVIRCVGDADTRFCEDALRILRALRFASVLDFKIEKRTQESIHKNKALLKNIAVERIFVEFSKLICGKSAPKILSEYKDVFNIFIPQLSMMFDFAQNTKYHIYDVWEHSICALSYTNPKLTLRLAALFHDIGKPDCHSIDYQGCDHFYGHSKKSVEHTRAILNALKCDNKTKDEILLLIEHHDTCISPKKSSVKRLLNKIGKDHIYDLIELWRADTFACAPQFIEEKLYKIEQIKELVYDIIKDDECFSLKNLAVNGSNMIDLGYDGKDIGAVLETLLNKVIDGKTENEKQALIKEAAKLKMHKNTEADN